MDKIVFEMGSPDPKKHSTRFDFSQLVTVVGDGYAKWNPSFYIPKPFAERAKRIRVTIEVVE